MTQDQPPRLLGLLCAQALGAFNDNAWKMITAFLLIRAAGAAGPELEAVSQSRTTLAFVTFTLPLLLFSLPAAAIADRVSKRTLIVVLKGVEVLLLLAGALVLAIDPHGGPGALVVLGLMGAHSALFSPAKYGILPELVPAHRLPKANGVLELMTFLGIVLGTAAGGALLEQGGARPYVAALVLAGLACVGFVAALRVPRVAAGRSRGSVVASVRGALAAIRADRPLYLAVIGSACYWGIASLDGQVVFVYAKATLGIGDSLAALPLALCGIGVGVGCMLAGRLCGGRIEIGLIPLGAMLLAVLTALLGALAPGFGGVIVAMVLLGVASGLVVVPLNSLIQSRAPAALRGGVIALANMLAFAGILAGSLGADLLARAGFGSPSVLLVSALVTLGLTVWALWLLPQALVRLLLVLLTKTVYRLRIVGREHLPAEGGALIVCNHVTFVDGLLVLASCDRQVRFLVDHEWFHRWWLRPVMRLIGALPVNPSSPRELLRSLREAGHALDRGELVCIFAEGEITRHGGLLSFRRGMERITKGRNAPIVPAHLDRVWGSVFSFAKQGWLRFVNARLPFPVTVSFGTPLPATTPVATVRQAVVELGAEAWALRAGEARPLHHGVIRGLRRRPLAPMFFDAQGTRLSRVRVLAGAVALARALRGRWTGQERVGLLLPPSCGGALANLAATVAGRVTVNLNYTAGPGALASACRQAGLQTVLTSRAFLARLGLELPAGVEPIWIEEVIPGVGLASRWWALLLALLAPVRWLERACGSVRAVRPDDVATVIFSSGSTGEPKGVELSHWNVSANVAAIAQVTAVTRHDRVLGVLPLFHSFGTLTLWFALRQGLGIAFHPTPLDAEAVGTLVQRHQLTILLATPTFLQLYLRRCTPGQFGSLRLVLAGAERLSPRLADAFEEKFGIAPLEGYGTTECAPAVAVSTSGFRAPGFFQAGSRRGSVGRPLPGVALRIVDPDTGAALPTGGCGMLLVRGPNVMRGYLGRPDLDAAALRDGWYVTGDLAVIDDDGFLRIADRLARFSKIGGEMVPHGKIEDALQEAAGRAEQVFAVTAVPDERKGERLVVLTTLDDAAIDAAHAALGRSGLPNLFLPRRECYLRVAALPVLGTGKLDLRGIKAIARERLGQPC